MNRQHHDRRSRAYLSALGTTQLHLRNPWIVAFFSFSFPGFGYLMLERYLVAFIFIGWEVFINTKSNINVGILYTLLGDFDQAKQILDERWLILYVSIYLYNIWDCYRLAVDLNKQYLLADREDAPLRAFKFAATDINFLDKKNPALALVWSVLAPGVGHLYVHKVITGFFIFGATISLIVMSNIPLAIQYTATGHFELAKKVLDMQWTLYLPSMFAFIYYDAYISAIELNKLFEKEQSKYLRQRYQDPAFPMPLPDGESPCT